MENSRYLNVIRPMAEEWGTMDCLVFNVKDQVAKEWGTRDTLRYKIR